MAIARKKDFIKILGMRCIKLIEKTQAAKILAFSSKTGNWFYNGAGQTDFFLAQIMVFRYKKS
jgi:hypothetical protein